MADEKKPEIWFPAKRYGWGWGLPITWQGWVVMLGWIALFFVGVLVLVTRPVELVVFSLVMAVLLTAVCYAKGEPPRWRWGDDGRG
jgi:hypothetical protein